LRPSIRRLLVHGLHTLIILALLAAWQYLPHVGWLARRSHLFDPFFVSSPVGVTQRLITLVHPPPGQIAIWSFLWATLSASVEGTAIGMTLGAVLGLLLSTSAFFSEVLRPFVVAANAVPRIALIPVIILLVGPTFQASLLICFLVVFFVAFFNAYEGGRVVAPNLLDNAQILGASRLQIMWHIRSPYVLAWTLAALPLGVTFAVISVVTGEILTGYPGLGRLILDSEATADSSLTFAVVIVLSVTGMAIVAASELVKTRLLFWWVK